MTGKERQGADRNLCFGKLGFCIFLEGCIDYSAQHKSQVWCEYRSPGNILHWMELPICLILATYRDLGQTKSSWGTALQIQAVGLVWPTLHLHPVGHAVERVKAAQWQQNLTTGLLGISDAL